MTRDTFKIIHSELIQQVQGIEYDLKIIYAAIKDGDFEKNFLEVKNLSLGEITHDLRELDYSDSIPDLSNEEYELIDKIRVIRNYWCHQCYIDFMYISNDSMREEKFQKIAKRLSDDENKTYALFSKLEKFRMTELKTYGRI